MAIRTEISIGEFLDKLTILEIKRERIREDEPRANVLREIETLQAAWRGSPYASEDVDEERAALRVVNEKLWEIEDRLRAKEAAGAFDDEFVELARAVYLTNDERSAIKRRLNLRLGSSLIEEKQHVEYRSVRSDEGSGGA